MRKELSNESIVIVAKLINERLKEIERTIEDLLIERDQLEHALKDL
jgi:phage regulator Rha-like protein